MPEQTNQAPADDQQDKSIPVDDVINALPEGYTTFGGLLEDFAASLPPGAPPLANSLMRRVFVAGAAAVMTQIHRAFMSEATQAGDAREVVAVVNALGVGVQVAISECELEAASDAAAAQRGGIIIPIHASQVN